jgi:hypothetical protein
MGQWYRGQYGSLVKCDKNTFAELFAGVDAPGKPRLPQVLHFYSSRYWDSRVKERFESRWRALLSAAKHRDGEPPVSIAVQNSVTLEVWNEETPQFQDEVRRARDIYHAGVVKAWEESLADSLSKTPEELGA